MSTARTTADAGQNSAKPRNEIIALKAECERLRGALKTIAASATPLAGCPWTGFQVASLAKVLARLADIARAALAQEASK